MATQAARRTEVMDWFDRTLAVAWILLAGFAIYKTAEFILWLRWFRTLIN